MKQGIKLTNPIHLLAIGFGSGLSPTVPGTMGTIVGVIIWWFCLQGLSLPIYWGIVIVAGLVGIYLCDKTAKDMGVHDAGCIVWDEFVGVWITLAFIPQLLPFQQQWQWVLAAFLLFRLFDMVKPWPISWFDKHVHGGFGIMIDDIIAGFIAAIPIVLFNWYMI